MLAQIETAFAQRTRSEERLRSFLADASHELRTPLTSIQGYAELLRKDALPDTAARDRALGRIEQEAARMGVLVGDLAVLAREGEGPPPERSPVDLAALVAAVVDDARVIDGSRPIELDGPRPVMVLGDPARLEQLVHNLVGNALAHTPAGTPVEVRVAADGARAVLEVRDHGPGMEPDQADRVFDRFYRGTGTERDSGSGLGLFIVASLARTFGGEASVESAAGEGATFTVVLPLHRGPAPPRVPRAAVPPAAAPEQPTPGPTSEPVGTADTIGARSR
jgi:two-component system OmpR family sensor kinase